MPANQRSLHITDNYRRKLAHLRLQAAVVTRRNWAAISPADLDGTFPGYVAATAPALTELQRAGGRLSLAYLTAFLTSETGRRVPTPDVAVVAGQARDGRPLADALVPPLFTVKQQIGAGHEMAAALTMGLNRALRTASEEAIAPARASLSDGMRAEGRVIGWRRVTGGGCGACIAAATGAIHADDEALEVHPACQCSTEPVVADVPDRVQRPTGPQIFEGMSAQEQDQLLGSEKAELIRSGVAALQDLIQRDHMAVIDDGITEAPLSALQHQS
jgi:hypothetical protein